MPTGHPIGSGFELPELLASCQLSRGEADDPRTRLGLTTEPLPGHYCVLVVPEERLEVFGRLGCRASPLPDGR